MHKFACKDLGIDCEFTATGENKEETLQKAMAHGGVVHKDLMEGQTDEQKAGFDKMLNDSIKPV